MGVTIRLGSEADLPAVADLCARWAAEGLTRSYRAESVAELAQRLGPSFYVAEVERHVVGFAIGEIRRCANNDAVEGAFANEPAKYLEIQDVYVHRPFRGGGIGTRLLETLMAQAEAKGLKCALVYSANVDYVRTARFYEKCGFRMWHIYMTREK